MDRYRILIIDDDPNLRKSLADILRLKGYEPLIAKNGQEGLALLAEQTVNLVLTDLQLPDLSGLEILQRIKADHGSLQTIILTGNATLDSAIEATNCGAFSYMVKPYDITQLLLNIRRAIEKQEAEEVTIRHNRELRLINSELKTLQEISQVIGRTLDMDDLLSGVLDAMVKTEIFPFEIRGGIFLVEQGRMRLASYVRVSEELVTPCREIFSNQCLCGLAMVSGEIIVSKDSQHDPRHVHCNHGSTPHGHIVVPLTAVQEVVGLISLLTQPDVEVSDSTLRVLAAIGSQVGIAINNAKLYERTRMSSLHDPLTGLANRRFLQLQMEKCFKVVQRYREELSLIMLDIDRFKEFNDSRGHLEGDRLLTQVADLLIRELRNADYIFRYGGEEFLCMLPKTDQKEACEVAERLREIVARETPVTISLGVATFRAGMTDREELIERADAALYLAKQNGRNRVEIDEDAVLD